MTARVCACVGLFAGVTVGEVSHVMGIHVNNAQMELLRLLRLGCVRRSREHWSRNGYVYRFSARKGMAWLEGEVVRVDALLLPLMARARECHYPRLDLLEQMEESLRKGSV